MKTVIEMAREAGMSASTIHTPTMTQFLERFAELVRADERNRTWTQDHWTEYERSIAAQEREACAKVCIDLPAELEECEVLNRAAAAIRARSNT